MANHHLCAPPPGRAPRPGVLPGSRRSRTAIGCALALALGSLLLARPAAAQFMDSIPTTGYYAAFASFYDGDYRDALAVYLTEQQGGSIKTGSNRWIDSVCYYTMAGECYYHMGQLPQALAQYTAALEYFCANHDWMLRGQFPVSVGAASGAAPVTPWGVSRRGAHLGSIPNQIMFSRGQINNNQVIMQGGVVQAPMLFPVNASEIVRATTIAIRRRRELLGPISKHDPLTGRVIAALAARPGPPNNWSEAWIDVQLGAAYASAENYPQAITCLQRSLVVGGEFDHPLTGTALFELGLITLQMGDFVSAGRYFEETTYSAVIWQDFGLLEEAFRFGALNHVISGQKGIYPPLLTAATWAKAQGFRQLNGSVSVMAAENFAAHGDTPRAVAMLTDARNVIGRHDMLAGDLGARMNHVTSLTSYQLGNATDGDAALLNAMTYERHGSLWVFQLNLANDMFVSGALNERVGLLLYEALLRDPTPADWLSSPLECLALLMTPHPAPYENWFNALLKHGTENRDLAVEVADRKRRHDFYSTLPFGGRMLALRWLLEGPVELLSDQARLQRQELLSRYSDYEQLGEKARKLKSLLASKPLAPETPEGRKEQVATFNELAGIGHLQELLLRQMAVRREAADFVFPPVRATNDVQRALNPGQVLLVFVNTDEGLHAFVYGREKYTDWRVSGGASLPKTIAGMLREMGHVESNHLVSLADLGKDSWRKMAARILDTLSEKHLDLSAKFDEIVIVPDGPLWYLPFEALPIDKAGTPLISHVRVRYAPTVGLAIPYSRVDKPNLKVGVVNGRLYPQDDASVSQAAFAEIRQALPGAIAWPSTPPAASSLYRSLFDELIVLDDIRPSDGPYDWSPAQLDRNKPGSTLDAWLHLPWGNPEKIILPGFHSAAENGLKHNATGQDIFLSVCGLMGSGVRTALISRWRTGGQSSIDLMREFAQELPNTSAADAWQRSVLLATSRPLDVGSEPRLKINRADAATPNADHPFFWAGYMLVDSGRLPPDKDPPPPPVLNFKKPGPAGLAPAGAAPGAAGRAVPAGKFPIAPAPAAGGGAAPAGGAMPAGAAPRAA